MTPRDFSRLDRYFLANACLGYILATLKIVALSPVVGLERARVKGSRALHPPISVCVPEKRNRIPRTTEPCSRRRRYPCQFVVIVVTPLNWRIKAEELEPALVIRT